MANRLDGVLLRGEDLEFYRAAGRGQLILARCLECPNVAIAPRWICAECGSTRVEPVASTRLASVLSVTTVFRSANPALVAPYQVAIVQLAEGPSMMVDIVGDQCGIGERVVIEFVPENDGLAVPVARRASSGEAENGST